jgi:hypothetical protein
VGNDLERDGLIEDYSNNYLVVLRGTTKRLVLITGVPVEIRTEHLLNTSLESYNYTSLLGEEIIDSLILVQNYNFACGSV